MKIVRYDRFGGIDELWIDEVPAPVPAAGQVIVAVEASCLNPGSLSALHGAAYVPARDLAGTVVAHADDVAGFTVGDEVLGWVQDWAAHAELVAVPATQLVAKPAELPWDVAGSCFVTPMAGSASVQAVGARVGETVVVAGASGGVGSTAAQLARRAGARVLGIAGARNAERLREMGIEPVTREGDVVAQIKDTTVRVDAFVDAVGSGYVALAVELGVAPQRINTVVDFAAAREHGAQTRGTMQAGGLPGLAELARLAAAGDLQIPIARSFPLGDVQAAYRELAQNRPAGRIVLHPQE